MRVGVPAGSKPEDRRRTVRYRTVRTTVCSIYKKGGVIIAFSRPDIQSCTVRTYRYRYRSTRISPLRPRIMPSNTRRTARCEKKKKNTISMMRIIIVDYRSPFDLSRHKTQKLTTNKLRITNHKSTQTVLVNLQGTCQLRHQTPL